MSLHVQDGKSRIPKRYGIISINNFGNIFVFAFVVCIICRKKAYSRSAVVDLDFLSAERNEFYL